MTRAMRLGFLSLAVLAAAAFLAPWLSASPRASGVELPYVALMPSSPSVVAGADASVQVQASGITDADGLGAYEVGILFDPSVLTFESYANGPFLASTGRSVICLPAVFDQDLDTVPDPGFVRLGCVTSGATPPGPTGNGLLATLTFSTSCAGSSGLTYGLSGLSDPLGNEIAHGESSATVLVTGAPSCATPGDVDCDTNVTAVDATLILQDSVGLLGALPCPQNGDANDDTMTNPVDATLVLQFVVGLLDQLPP